MSTTKQKKNTRGFRVCLLGSIVIPVLYTREALSPSHSSGPVCLVGTGNIRGQLLWLQLVISQSYLQYWCTDLSSLMYFRLSLAGINSCGKKEKKKHDTPDAEVHRRNNKECDIAINDLFSPPYLYLLHCRRLLDSQRVAEACARWITYRIIAGPDEQLVMSMNKLYCVNGDVNQRRQATMNCAACLQINNFAKDILCYTML